jgi:hypothetical protein
MNKVKWKTGLPFFSLTDDFSEVLLLKIQTACLYKQKYVQK